MALSTRSIERMRSIDWTFTPRQPRNEARSGERPPSFERMRAMTLAASKTEQNLKEAFAGESQANRR
jgi:hypothetical protein